MNPDELPIEYLRRMVAALNDECETVLQDLKTPQAVMAFFQLWETYDTEFWEGVLDAIEGGDDPQPAEVFVMTHDLPKPRAKELEWAIKAGSGARARRAAARG